MLKTQEFVPSIYYNSSRDFQYLAHLFDLVFNSIKTEADLIFNLPFSVNSDDQLLDLLTYTFGLKVGTSRFSSKQLRALCAAAPTMMKNKGSILAIRALCKALLNADGIEDGFGVEVDHKNCMVTISIVSQASCINLITAVLPYILPAGFDFNILIAAEKPISGVTTRLDFSDTVTVTPVDSRIRLGAPKPNSDNNKLVDVGANNIIIDGYAYDSKTGLFNVSEGKLSLRDGHLSPYSQAYYTDEINNTGGNQNNG